MRSSNRRHGVAGLEPLDAVAQELVTVGVEEVEERAAEELPRLGGTRERGGGGIGENNRVVAADDDCVGRPLDQPAEPFVRAGHGIGPVTDSLDTIMPVNAVGGQSANGSVGTVQCVLRRFTHMPDSPKERFQQLLFYALVLLMAYLAVLVLGPFLAPLAWAAVFAMMFHGVHKELQPKIGASNAALSTTVMAGILIVAPAVTLVSVFAREVPPLIDYLKSADLTSPDRIEQAWQVVRRNSPMALPEDPTALLREGCSARSRSLRRAPAPWWPTCSRRSAACS